ncbi:MAG: glycosyltransferase family 4 protein [Janthinobacterium lividum]
MTEAVPTEDSSERVRVAYLVSHYPALSHAFIEREVLALRSLGADVQTFSIRPSPIGEQRSAVARDEAGRTFALLGRRPVDYLSASVKAATRSPRSIAAGVLGAVKSGPRALKPRIWQFFYLAEAVVLREEMRARGLRHVHVHFANNGADVARSVVTMGRAEDGPDAGWTWTLSMHGPTEFSDVEGYDLAAKVRSAAAVACISEFCRGALRELVPPEHWRTMHIVRMGVDSERFTARPGRREEGPLRLLFVGRLVAEKGPDVLLDALDHLRRDGLQFEAAVAGAGPLAEELATRLAGSPLGQMVQLVGPVGQDELREHYEWADVFCLPSFEEGVPVVLMEAMSMGLPVVSTTIAGIPELVTDGVTGFLVPPGDAAGVAAAIATLASDPALRARMGTAGRKVVRGEFQPVPNARRLLRMFATSSRPERERLVLLPGDRVDVTSGAALDQVPS